MDFFSPIFLGLVVTISFTWVGYSQPDDPAGFQSAPDISKLDIFYYHCHSIDSFTMKYKQVVSILKSRKTRRKQLVENNSPKTIGRKY